MILTIFILLIAVSFLLLFYGYYSKTDLPRLMGFLLLFFLGSAIMPSLPGTVEYCDGKNLTTIYQYGNNFTGYHWDYDTGTAPDGPQLDAYLFHTMEIDTCIYSTYQDHTIGFYIMLTGLLGFILIMFERRKRRSEDVED